MSLDLQKKVKEITEKAIELYYTDKEIIKYIRQ